LTEVELDPIWPALLDGIPITVALLDHERRMVYANHVEHGWDPGAVVGRQIDELLPAADRARITRIIDEVLRTGAPSSYETSRMTPSGFVRYLVRLGALKVDAAVRYAILVSLDITKEHEQHQLAEREHALLAALEPVNRILLSAPLAEPMFDRILGEMLALFDCDRAFLAYPCDPNASEFSILYEQSVPEFPGARGVTFPVDATVIERFELALRQQGAVRNDPECNPIRTDRSPLRDFGVRSMLFAAVRTELDKPWLLGIQHCREARIYDMEVQLLSAIAARIGDALQTWRTQQAMLQAEQRFRLLVEHAPEALVILDVTTGKFVEVNNRAIELYGMTREQLLQVGPVELSPETQPDGSNSAERAGPILAATLAGESPVFEWTHRRASGELIECEIRLLHLPHPEHRWIRGSIFDIADRKRAQRENERLSAQLAQAQKMEAIGHLTGGVAHDFNNLLTVIGGALEMMMQVEARGTGDIQEYGSLALEACRRAASLTQRLLAFSRQQPLRPRAVDIELLLRGMEGLLARSLGETVQIEVRCSPDLWLCEVDPAQLESAILNLSINARDAMPGGGRLEIDARNMAFDAGALPEDGELSAGDYVMLCVTDNGSGIAPELLDKVFEPFFTTKEVGKGSGLGLSMVYGFAKQSRGHVKIYSELGQGTTVKLFLPRSHNVTVAPADLPGPSVPLGNGELVLVVEDDAKLRALAVELLRRVGYRAVAAGDAASALGLLAETPDVKLLLADMVLPGGTNGVDLARRAHAMRPRLPVLFMSGYTENAIIHNGRLDEGVRLLEKPFTTYALATAVRSALSGK
jgi:PAS domain S-box-containing protein